MNGKPCVYEKVDEGGGDGSGRRVKARNLVVGDIVVSFNIKISFACDDSKQQCSESDIDRMSEESFDKANSLLGKYTLTEAIKTSIVQQTASLISDLQESGSEDATKVEYLQQMKGEVETMTSESMTFEQEWAAVEELVEVSVDSSEIIVEEEENLD